MKFFYIKHIIILKFKDIKKHLFKFYVIFIKWNIVHILYIRSIEFNIKQ